MPHLKYFFFSFQIVSCLIQSHFVGICDFFKSYKEYTYQVTNANKMTSKEQDLHGNFEQIDIL